jgi:3-hydroxybutyryl-CoA dehydrogenase
VSGAIDRVGVVGGGQMGAGIAEVCARGGVDVVVHEIDEALAAAARARVEASVGRAVERGKLTAEERDAALGRIRFGSDLEAMADRQLVVEAVVEDETLKRDVFARLDAIVEDPGAVLASNTSSIPIVRLATATSRPGSVVGMHFFNPAPVMPLVEIVRSVVVSGETVERAAAFATETLGKVVVHAKDRAGFIVNLLLCPYLFEAIRMLESGFASRDDIDTAMVNGASHPMGPLALCDLVGNDTLLAVAESLFEEYREPRYAPPPLLRRMVDANMLGRKTGRGFYDYEHRPHPAPNPGL